MISETERYIIQDLVNLKFVTYHDFRSTIYNKGIRLVDILEYRSSLLLPFIEKSRFQSDFRCEVYTFINNLPYYHSINQYFSKLHKMYKSLGYTGIPSSVFPYFSNSFVDKNWHLRFDYPKLVEKTSASAYLKNISEFVDIDELTMLSKMRPMKGFSPAQSVFRKTMCGSNWHRIIKRIDEHNFDEICPLDEWQFVLLFKRKFYQKLIQRKVILSPSFIEFLESRIMKIALKRAPTSNLRCAMNRLKMLKKAVEIYTL